VFVLATLLALASAASFYSSSDVESTSTSTSTSVSSESESSGSYYTSEKAFKVVAPFYASFDFAADHAKLIASAAHADFKTCSEQNLFFFLFQFSFNCFLFASHA
jgi:hypothetical protein